MEKEINTKIVDLKDEGRQDIGYKIIECAFLKLKGSMIKLL